MITNVDSTVSAHICHTHHGHAKQLEHAWLPKSKREQIAALLQQGVSQDRILHGIREETVSQTNGEFKRHHLADKKDLNNIKTSFQLKDTHGYPDNQ